jgi:hypothetical protein
MARNWTVAVSVRLRRWGCSRLGRQSLPLPSSFATTFLALSADQRCPFKLNPTHGSSRCRLTLKSTLSQLRRGRPSDASSLS